MDAEVGIDVMVICRRCPYCESVTKVQMVSEFIDVQCQCGFHLYIDGYSNFEETEPNNMEKHGKDIDSLWELWYNNITE